MKNSTIQRIFIGGSLAISTAILLVKIIVSPVETYVDHPVAIVLLCIVSGIAGIFLSLAIHIILHETGHLIFGLAEGFRFKSFRIGNITLLRTPKGFTLARYSIPGTGGQCLMDPPEQEATTEQLQKYLLGGVAVNLLLILLNILALILVQGNLYLLTALSGALFLGMALTAVNIYPFKGNVIPNDICNYISLTHDPLSRTIMLNQLRINSCVIEEQKIRDIDPDYFRLPADIDYSNFIHINAMLTSATYLMERHEFGKAKNLFDKIRFKSRILPGPIRKEVKCNIVLILLIEGKKNGRFRAAENLFDRNLREYAEKMRKYMPDKYTLLIAYYHLAKQDEEKAGKLLREMEKAKGRYIGNGEIEEEVEFLNKFIFS